MGGGGKSGGSTKVQSTPAKYIMPYLTGKDAKGNATGTTGVLPEAESQYKKRTEGYTPYGGELVADFGQDTQDYFSGVRGLNAGVDDMASAVQGTKNAGVGYLGAGGNYDPTTFTGNVLTGQDISRYMNPYTEDVISRQMASMAKQRDEAAAGLRANQAVSGALGGSRAAVEKVLQNQKYNETMANTEAELRMKGYDQATATALAQQKALNEAARDTEQSKQFGATFEEEAAADRAKYGLAQAEQLGRMSEAERAQEMERLNALKGIGTMQTAQSQAEMDAAYKQFLEGRDWDANELARYAQLIYGAPQGQTQTSSQSMSPWSNILGAGMFMAGLPTAGGGSLLGSMFGFKDGGVMDVERMMKDNK